MPEGKLINVDNLWKKDPTINNEPKSKGLDRDLMKKGVVNSLKLSQSLVEGIGKLGWRDSQKDTMFNIFRLVKRVANKKISFNDRSSGRYTSSVDYNNNVNVDENYKDPGLHVGISFVEADTNGQYTKNSGAINIFMSGSFRLVDVENDFSDTRANSIYKELGHDRRTEDIGSERTTFGMTVKDFSRDESALLQFSMYRYSDRPRIVIESLSWRQGKTLELVVSKNEPQELSNDPRINNFFMAVVDGFEKKVFPCRQ